jgi:DnaJ-class molecular chaperone
MQVKKKLVVFAVMLAMGCVGVFASRTFAENKGPETVTLDYNKAKKKVENFNHKKHQEEIVKGDCKVCHHKKEEGKDARTCASCHADKSQEIKDSKGKVMKIQDAYHERCKGCHKKEKKGPTKCKECHGED